MRVWYKSDAMNEEIPVTVVVGTQVLAAWCGFQLGYAALHRFVASDGVGAAAALVIAILAVLGIRFFVSPRHSRVSVAVFVVLSGVAFMTLVAPMPLPFTSP